MKKQFFIALALLFSATAFGQSITGTWEGNINAGGSEIPIVFHIAKDSSGKLTGMFDSPSQKAYNLACSAVLVSADSILIMMNILKGKYTGKLSADKKQITGTWFQGGGSVALNITKTSEEVKIKELKRPQTPKPPFPYKAEDVEYTNADKSISFGGTFTVPLPDPNVEYFRAPVYPTVMLITGSGKQDRDENIFDHKPFAVIADYLTRNGYAVLRVDDRDMGKTTGNFNKATSADFANDVEAGINYLKTRKDVDSNFIGLLGHSEGGMIAPMVAARRADIKFIILLAGPGIKIVDLMTQQNIDLGISSGASAEEMENFRPLYKALVNAIVYEKDSSKLMPNASMVFKAWRKDKPDSLVKHVTGVTDERSMLRYLRIYIQTFRATENPWFNYFIQYDPSQYISQLKCPVLALNGEKDIQVAAGPNLKAIEAALDKGGNKNYHVELMPGLNHLFQHCTKCTVEEYSDLEESFSPEVLELIKNWIKEAVK